jgi:hypothetical protein
MDFLFKIRRKLLFAALYMSAFDGFPRDCIKKTTRYARDGLGYHVVLLLFSVEEASAGSSYLPAGRGRGESGVVFRFC